MCAPNTWLYRPNNNRILYYSVLKQRCTRWNGYVDSIQLQLNEHLLQMANVRLLQNWNSRPFHICLLLIWYQFQRVMKCIDNHKFTRNASHLCVCVCMYELIMEDDVIEPLKIMNISFEHKRWFEENLQNNVKLHCTYQFKPKTFCSSHQIAHSNVCTNIISKNKKMHGSMMLLLFMFLAHVRLTIHSLRVCVFRWTWIPIYRRKKMQTHLNDWNMEKNEIWKYHCLVLKFVKSISYMVQPHNLGQSIYVSRRKCK